VILVVDDDVELRSAVRIALEREGFAVDEAGDGDIALAKIATLSPELVVLDLRLPSVGGLEVLRTVSAGSGRTPPVIALTGLGDEADRIVGLELGADDYIVKPFSLRELVARVRSVLRRSTATAPSSVLEFGDLRVDIASREVSLRGEPVNLRRREFDLLAFLCASPRRVLTRDQLLLNVWHSAPEWQTPATVSEHVHRLRSRIEDDPTRPRRIVTVRGVGYRFEP
jgi:two-component system alkaline phosphatase synthesis response regulator PhoP